MTNPESRRVWAKILLGIPENEQVHVDISERQEHSNKILREAGQSEDGRAKQTVMVLDAIALQGKWRRQSLLRPLPGELNS